MVSGAARHFSGHEAEETVRRLYEAKGGQHLASRWKCPEGEIDLVMQTNGSLIFVEVKLRRTIDEAAASISARQWERIAIAAQAFVIARGLALETDMRFDAALLDRSGNCEIIENATFF